MNDTIIHPHDEREPQWVEITAANIWKCNTNITPSLIHYVIKTGFKNLFMVVHIDEQLLYDLVERPEMTPYQKLATFITAETKEDVLKALSYNNDTLYNSFLTTFVNWDDEPNSLWCRKYVLEDHPEVIYIISTSINDLFFIVREDAYELHTGRISVFSKNDIYNNYGIKL